MVGSPPACKLLNCPCRNLHAANVSMKTTSNKSLIRHLLLTLMAVLALPAHAAPEAPFGLAWGAQPEVLRGSTPGLEFDQQRINLRSYSSNSVPVGLPHAAEYHLLFDELAGLVKVQYLSVLIEGDADGMLGRERYRELKLSLSNKYGMPEVDEMIGLSASPEQPSFYVCLREKNCGWWHTTFRAEGMTIRLQLHGVRNGAGFISLAYESPEFATALGRYELMRERTHDEAL